jgi:S-formylglutathione hydrolase FrmB
MSLTSTPFLAALAIIAVGSAAAATVWWHRLAGSGRRVLAARVGAILLVQWTGVALVAGVVNAKFDFYPTLSALMGNVGASALQNGGRPTSGWVTIHSDNAASVALHHPTRTPWGDLWIDPDSPSYGVGTSLEGELLGAVSHQHNSRLRIWLPRQYADPAYASYKFPVVVTFTGFPGNPLTWWKTGFVQRAQSAIDSGEVTPFVIAALTADPTPTRDTECTNVPRGPQIETFLSVDVPNDLRHLVRAAPLGASWAVMGDSAGGYCSMLLGLDHPNVFHNVVSLGGYTNAITDVTTGNLDGGSAAHRRMRDLLWKVKHEPPPNLSMLMAAATGDRGSVPMAFNMAMAARAPLRITRLVTQGGGHNWVTWEAQLPLVLRWLGRHLSPAAGLPGGR